MLFFFNDTATTEIYTLSLHDALPISRAILGLKTGASSKSARLAILTPWMVLIRNWSSAQYHPWRSEEHTSELQSQSNLVCRLLLEKKDCVRQHNLSRTHSICTRKRAP